MEATTEFTAPKFMRNGAIWNKLTTKKMYRDANQEARANVDFAVSTLATFDMTPWREGARFYVDSGGVKWSAALGVLATAILGAPFWYERLEEAAKLKDLLKPPKKKQGRTTVNPPEQPDER